MAITYVGGAADSVLSGTSVTVTHGLTINENDVIVAFMHGNNTTPSFTSSGFTTEFEETNPTIDTSAYGIMYKVAGASEPSSYTFNSGQAADRNQVSLVVFRGINTASVWDVTPSASTRGNADSGTTATAPAMTITGNNAAGIVAFMRDSGGTFNSVTNSYTNEVTAAVSQECLHVWTRIFTSSGSSGTTQATLSADDAWVAVQIALAEDVGTVISVPVANSPLW